MELEKIKVGQIYLNQEIIDYTFEGKGITKNNNFVIFVDNAIKGEIVDLEIIKSKKNFGFGKIIAIKKRSPQRMDLTNKKQEKYTGCDLQFMNYEEQLELKKSIINGLLKKNKFNIKVDNIIANENIWQYRNKIGYTFGYKNNEIILGFNLPKTHDVVEVDNSLLISPSMNKIVNYLQDFFRYSKEKVLNIENNKGNLYQLVIKETSLKEVGISIICQNGKFQDEIKLIESLVQTFPNIKYINIDQLKKGKQKVQSSRLVYGAGYVIEKINNFNFQINSHSFFQINTKQAEKLYNEALNLINFKNKIVLDAYSGIGAISLLLAQKAKLVVGVEINSKAVKDAKINQKLNNIRNVKFICSPIEKELQIFDKRNYDILVVDPPRRGLDKNFIKLIMEKNIKEILYISCNPLSLISNLNLLKAKYQIKKIIAVDLFSQTKHIETIVKLQLKN